MQNREVIDFYTNMNIFLNANEKYIIKDDAQLFRDRLQFLLLQEEFGIPLQDHYMGTTCIFAPYNGIPDQSKVMQMGKEFHRTISYLDFGYEQPQEGEWVYSFSFPSGAYTYHDDYPVETFNAMFNELVQELEPTYLDTVNKTLYFSAAKASRAFQESGKIYKKYVDKVQDELKQKRINQMQEQIKQLQGEIDDNLCNTSNQ